MKGLTVNVWFKNVINYIHSIIVHQPYMVVNRKFISIDPIQFEGILFYGYVDIKW